MRIKTLLSGNPIAESARVYLRSIFFEYTLLVVALTTLSCVGLFLVLWMLSKFYKSHHNLFILGVVVLLALFLYTAFWIKKTFKKLLIINE